MKTIRLILLITWATNIIAQPTIQWQKTFGGSFYEQFSSILSTSDGGYIAAGFSNSEDGDVAGLRGYNDALIFKLDAVGNLQWKQHLGGSHNDYAHCILETSDGGYLVVGSTRSTDFGITNNHGGLGDGWVVKLAANGAIEWQRANGGSYWEEFWGACHSHDDGFVLTGFAESVDGDVVENKGSLDYWVVKINNLGEIIWERTSGGSFVDNALSVKPTTDGGFMVVGEAASVDGDITEPLDYVNYWAIKLDALGDLEWQKTLGSDLEDIAEDVTPVADGYIVIGYVSGQNTGQVSGHDELGTLDCWVVKLDFNGDIVWQKALGGSQPEWGRAVLPLDDGSIMVVGGARSTNGDVVGNDGGAECWLVKLSSTGELLWQQTYGGTLAEQGFAIDQTPDNGFIMAGYAWSDDGDLEGSLNRGKNDFWVAKLSPESISSQNTPHTTETLQISPNPAQQYANIEVPTQENSVFVTLSDLLGRVVIAQEMENHATINMAGLNPGVYFVTAKTDNGQVFRGKLEKIP